MKIIQVTFAAIALLTAVSTVKSSGKDSHTEDIGDFDQWVVRHIKESAVIGGQEKIIYAIGPADTILTNMAYITDPKISPWSVSNAYAKVIGIEKASGTVSPERRGDGWCCRLDIKAEQVKVLGLINLQVMVTGTIFTGRTLEPVSDASKPYTNIDFGIPFSGRPKAMVFDYKARISEDNTYTVAKAGKRPVTVSGHDEAQAYLILQRRWEDSDGNIYAVRVGTAYEKFPESKPDWDNGHRAEVHYGNISSAGYFRPYMDLNSDFHAVNSRGKVVPVHEIGWASADETPTHVIIAFSAGSQAAFAGHEGNALWVDNVKLEY